MLVGLLGAGCEDLRVAVGARDLLAHYQRCKLVDTTGALSRDGDGRIDAVRAGRGTARCRQGKALVTLRITAVEPARLELAGPRRLADGEAGTYTLRAFDAGGSELRVGRVVWQHGPELARVPRCPPELPSCPDFLDSIQLARVAGADGGTLRACVLRCVAITIGRR